MYHVYGHLDKYLTWAELTVEERINVDCDHAAEEALVAGLELRRY